MTWRCWRRGSRPQPSRAPIAACGWVTASRKKLLKLIARRRRRLRKEGAAEGQGLYRHTPSKFVRRFGEAYARAERAADLPEYL